jgi:hypothetical protein
MDETNVISTKGVLLYAVKEFYTIFEEKAPDKHKRKTW